MGEPPARSCAARPPWKIFPRRNYTICWRSGSAISPWRNAPWTLSPGATAEVPFEFPLPVVTSATVRGTAGIQHDHLPDDDQAYFCLSIYQAPRVLVVEGQQVGPETLHSGFYLRKALAAGGDIHAESHLHRGAGRLPVGGILRRDSRGCQHQRPGIGAAGTNAAERRHRGVLSSATTPASPISRGLNSCRPTDRSADFAGRDGGGAGDRPQHPLFVNAWDANTPFPAVPQQRMFNLTVAKTAKVLLTLGEKLPFIVAGKFGPGQSAGRQCVGGPVVGRPAVVAGLSALVKQIARWSAELDRQDGQLLVGDPLPPAPNLPRDQALTVTLPNGATQPSAPVNSSSSGRSRRDLHGHGAGLRRSCSNSP